MVTETRLALGYLLAAEDGVCALLNDSCWVYVNPDQKNETDINTLKTHLKVIHELRQASPLHLFGWLTSWLPHLGTGL